MSKIQECPKCGTDISDTYETADPEVGIMGAGYFCEACDLFVEVDDDRFDDD